VPLAKAAHCAHDCPSGDGWLHAAMQLSPVACTGDSALHATINAAAHAATHLTAASPVHCRRAALSRLSIEPPPCGSWAPPAAMMPRRDAGGQIL
jgi:hypothetical protein